MDSIIIRGAREHNLKNIDVTIPKNKLVVITGLSGSGKSTLAFDTIYAEGQRRYVESLSSYARQFLGMMTKPDVDSIDGLSPAISIEQKTTSKNPRSTVGTTTEIYDYLRLLFARIGTPYCPVHNIRIQALSPDKIAETIKNDFNSQITVLSPIVSKKKGTYEKLIEDLNKEGYSKVRVNGKIYRTDEKIPLSRYKMHDIEIVMDRTDAINTSRITVAIEEGVKKSDGLIKIVDDKNKEKLYSAKQACPVCGLSFEELQPRMFSFNSPFGACEECSGLGIKMEFDKDLITPDQNLSIADGAIKLYKNIIDGWRVQQLGVVAKENGFDIFTPINKLTKKQKDILFFGSEKSIDFKFETKNGNSFTHSRSWEGLIPQSERLYRQTESEYRKKELEKFMKTKDCPKCKGKRLKDKILAVKVNKKNIIEITELSIIKIIDFFKNIKITEKENEIAKHILKEINSRLDFLEKVGLGYLSLSRTAGSLSGGEAQRIKLATNLGTNLTGVLYVLDEPSIGLHQKDNQKLINTLFKLRDLGNTLIVVEHDEDTIRQADFIIDMGPGAGSHGGEIVAKGTAKEIEDNPKSLTGNYLQGKEFIEVPKKRKEYNTTLKIFGAKENNLKNIDVEIPIGVLTAITGVSGSGKSTLIYEILYKALMNKFYRSKFTPGKHKRIDSGKIDKIISIDQSPIGRTPRSNPATYTKVFDEIRKIFTATRDARVKGFDIGRFSFNVKEGRCPVCSGDGQIKIEMNFLPDIYIDCEECKGKRYNKETLLIKYKDKTIADVLDMSVEEAYYFFENIPLIKRKLKTLMDVGLSYIKLGQSSVTLSGGEAQRIKITRELSKSASGNTIYLLDEPTTGLHFHDVKKLVEVLKRLIKKGNTVVVIEHNLEVIKSVDYIIDLGPDGGENGGEIIAKGTPEQLIKSQKSYTAKYLKKVL
ncbi:MAG: excinuclease ABC subunit UvrA [archaeon]|nr:excinuclease ABC subunit UvrA [archaeon]MDD2478055.1 excinuclease ABC subunit UvrA [Candidatus ainarchaeum sp.]MDD3084609.1 excinuclease ABC subunit UvrA [Candidatus ainarchaeum sp.]MDD4221102.1 excinuclease ABC subunit UvrA [Candidatus ainarchaeum sp.]MDD4662589.1 excinuclease ABC subunit UvrA [Candidatus ainarchaeum sp.]